MAISNNNTGLRPGVCTSSTRPVSPYNGQVIYETDTKQTLVYQGSSWVMLTDADTPPGMELVKAQTIGSAVSSITVTNAFSSTYDSYQITVSGGACGGDYGINMYLGSTRTGYYYSGVYLTYGNSNPWNLTGSNATEWGGLGIATTNTTYANIFVSNPYLSKNTYFSAFYTYGHPGGGNAANGGYLANSTSYTDFTLFINASSITGGTVRVYGFRNS